MVLSSIYYHLLICFIFVVYFGPLKCKLLESKGLACFLDCLERWLMLNNGHLIAIVEWTYVSFTMTGYWPDLPPFPAHFLLISCHGHFLPLSEHCILCFIFPSSLLPPFLSFPGQTITGVLIFLWGSSVYRAFIYICYYRCRWSVVLGWIMLAYNSGFMCRLKKNKIVKE